MITAGATPIEINCKIFDSGSKKSVKVGSKKIGRLVIAGGIVLLVGMSYAYTMLDSIDKDYHVFTVIIVPPLFMAVSIPVMIVGALLFRIKKRPKKYF